MKGVTLLEALFAIIIIGAGLIGVIYLFTGGTRSAVIADQTVIASNLAREKMEQIMADRVNKGYAATIATNYSDGQLSGDYSEFTRNVTIMEMNPDDDDNVDDFLDPQPGSGYARVTVIVSWKGGTKSVKEETLITDYTAPLNPITGC